MKNTIFALAFILINLGSANFAKASDMKSIEEVLNQEVSHSMLVYVMERCSGLFTSLYARFSNYDGDQYQQIANIMMQQMGASAAGALMAAEAAGLNLTEEKVMEKSLRFAEKYSEIMDEYYVNTGNSVSPFIEKDQRLCIEFNKTLFP